MTIRPIVALVACMSGSAPADPHWEFVNPQPVAGEITALEQPAVDTCWLATDGGALMVTTDNGGAWRYVALPRATTGPHLLDFTSGGAGFVAATADPGNPWGASVFKTEDGGVHWREWSVGSAEQTFNAGCLEVWEENALLGGSTTTDGIDLAVVYRLIGDRWESVLLPDSSDVSLRALTLGNQSAGWAVGGAGYAAYTPDGGRSWQRVETGTNDNVYAVAFVSPVVGWIGGGGLNRATLLKTVNGGGAWQAVGGLPASSRIVALRSYGRNGAVAVTRGGGDDALAHLLLATDGSNWSALGEFSQQLLDVVAVRRATIWTGGAKGLLARSVEGREVVEMSRRVTTDRLFDISFASSDVGWAVGARGTVLRTTDGGGSWSPAESFPGGEPTAIAAFDPARAILSCRGSLELLTVNGGRDWREVAVSGGEVTRIVAVEGAAYAVAGSNVSVSLDGGENWSETVLRAGGVVRDLGPADSRIAFAAIANDSVMLTDDGGQSWRATDRIPPDCQAITFGDPDHSWAAVRTEAGSRLWSSDDGWETRTRRSSLNYDVSRLRFTSPTEGWVVGLDGQFEALAGENVAVRESGLRCVNGVHGITSFGLDRVWVCGEGGLIARWGENWMGVGPKDFATPPSRSRLIAAWPNPTNGRVTIQLPNVPGTHSLRLIGSDGREVGKWESGKVGMGSERVARELGAGAGQLTLELGMLPAGVYWLNADRQFLAPAPIVLLK